MKFNLFCFLILVLLSPSLVEGLDLLSVSSASPVTPQELETLPAPPTSSEGQLESVLKAITRFDQAWKLNHPHEAKRILQWGVETCDLSLSNSLTAPLEKKIDLVRLVYACLILESEWISRASPWGQFKSSQRIEQYFKTVSNSEIPVSERLYAEGRIYSALPSFYGQDIKKAIVALEMLKRLEKNAELSSPWIKRTRKGQGKFVEDTESWELPILNQRKETDGLGVGVNPMIYAGFPQGLGLQLIGQDGALGDRPRRLQGRGFVTHRGSFGIQGKYEDYDFIEAVKIGIQFQFLHGIQEFHGLGINSPKNGIDLYIDKGVSDIFFQKNLVGPLYLKTGWRFHSSHLRKTEGGILEEGLNGISNAFDSGILAEIGYDTRDSEFEPYHGQRVFFQGYFPRTGFGSSRSFERYLMLAESFWPLTTQLHLKIQGFYSSVSETAPFDWFSSLSGTVPFSGIRATRYIDRSLLAAGSELRWKGLQPLTLFTYLNSATLSHETLTLLSQNKKVGAGGGVELHLTRFRNRAVRFELGNFGGEWGFNTMLGMPLD